MKNKIQITTIILGIILTMFFAVFIVPMVWGVWISLTNWNGISTDYQFIGIDNYVKMFQDTRFLESLQVTIKYMLILLICTLSFGYINARAIHKLKLFKSGVLFVSFFPYVVTPVVTCIIWNQLYIGIIPQVGEYFGVEVLKSNLLANSKTALLAVSLVDLWMLVPYATLLFVSAMNSIPIEIIEYAQVEGASPYEIAIFIESPYMFSTAGLITTVITSYSFTHIDTLMTLTSGGPGRTTETLYYTIYKSSTLDQRYAYGLAEGIVVAFFSIVIFIIINKVTNGKHVETIVANFD